MEIAYRALNFTERLRQAKKEALLKASPPRVIKTGKAKTVKVDKQQKKLEKKVDQFLAARHQAQRNEKKYHSRDPTAGKVEVRVDKKTTLFIDPAKNIPDVLEKYSSILNRSLKK